MLPLRGLPMWRPALVSNMRRVVVIPAYNEAGSIEAVVRGAIKHADVSVTNDGSKDETPAILSHLQSEFNIPGQAERLHVVTHEKSTHIPKGIQDGLAYAVEAGYDMIVTMDAGMSHDPEALPEFFEVDPSVDVVIGSRGKTQNVPLYRRMISRLAARVVNYSLTPSYFQFVGPNITDCTSGFRRYSLRAARLIAGTELRSKAFDFHMEALALCVRAGFTTRELSINYVFSNSSFNSRVLRQAMRFGLHLIATKGASSP